MGPHGLKSLILMTGDVSALTHKLLVYMKAAVRSLDTMPNIIIVSIHC